MCPLLSTHHFSFYKQIIDFADQANYVFAASKNLKRYVGTASISKKGGTLETWYPHSLLTRKINTNVNTVSRTLTFKSRENHAHVSRDGALLQIRSQSFSQRNYILTQSKTAAQQGVTMDNIFSDWNRERVQSQLHLVKPVRTVEMLYLDKKRPEKFAAVLIPLCLVNGQPSVLLTLRSSSLRKHRGEVSFPGGNQDETDPDTTYTALRETFEEIGLNPRHFDIWGSLSPTPSSKKSIVHPILARYTQQLDLNSLVLNSEEVEEVFTCAIQDLCDGGKIKVGSTQFRTPPGYTLPVYRGGPHKIWGLTAIILHQVLHLLAPGLYTYRIQHVS